MLDEFRLSKAESEAYTDELLGVAANRKALRAQEAVAALEARNSELELRVALLEGKWERMAEHIGLPVSFDDYDDPYDDDEY